MIFLFFLTGNSFSQKGPDFANFQPAFGSGILSNAFSLTSCGLNYTSGSVILCKSPQSFPYKGIDQPAAINITGLPVTAKIDRAFLWWDISGQDTSGQVIVSNPVSITDTFPGLKIGSVYDPCQDNYKTSFRANVTGIINGNGKYYISGLPSDSVGLGIDTDGATLFIIYKDSSASFMGTIVIYDGAVMAGNSTAIQTISGLNIPTNINGKAFMIISDMENKTGNSIKLNNGTYVGFVQNFWDYQEKTTAFLSGQTTSTFGVQMPNECANFIMMGIYFQETVIPVTPVITQKADTLISSSSDSYVWKYNGNFISGAINKKYLAQKSGNYEVVTTQSGSNCYYSSIIHTILTCSDRMKPNILKTGKVLITDSVAFPMQWFVDQELDSGRITYVDTARITGNYWVQVRDSISGCLANSDTIYVSLVGIHERIALGYIEAYPNPTSGILHLRFNNVGESNVILRIENIFGQRLFDTTIDCRGKESKYDVDLSGYPDGMYVFLHVSSTQNSIVNKILIRKD